jgi:hypothetical protein
MKRLRKHPVYHKSRHLGGKALGSMGFCTSWAVGREDHHPEWIEVKEIDLKIKDLPEQFKGKKIVHLSDLHCSRAVTERYLKNCIKRVNSLNPDIIFLTGDYITHDLKGKYRKKAVDIISKLEHKHGAYACLGNHDYGLGGPFKKTHKHHMHKMIARMEYHGINVLRNESMPLHIDGADLWMVGLGDLWAKDFKPHKAYKNVPAGMPVITLMHNPEGMEHLHEYQTDAVMSGHTHGVHKEHKRWTGMVKRRNYHAGMYHVKGKKLYVNRGLGRMGRARLNAPPEITVCTLC